MIINLSHMRKTEKKVTFEKLKSEFSEFLTSRVTSYFAKVMHF